MSTRCERTSRPGYSKLPGLQGNEHSVERVHKNDVVEHLHLAEHIAGLAQALPGPMTAFPDLHEQSVLEGAVGL
jgi:hypothetical protein